MVAAHTSNQTLSITSIQNPSSNKYKFTTPDSSSTLGLKLKSRPGHDPDLFLRLLTTQTGPSDPRLSHVDVVAEAIHIYYPEKFSVTMNWPAWTNQSETEPGCGSAALYSLGIWNLSNLRILSNLTNFRNPQTNSYSIITLLLWPLQMPTLSSSRAPFVIKGKIDTEGYNTIVKYTNISSYITWTRKFREYFIVRFTSYIHTPSPKMKTALASCRDEQSDK